ncbi:unnamed protein product [Ectocarpus sp. 6 AP-2014]
MDATAVDSGEAKLEGVDEAPCYYPTTAQFAEPLEFIASIRPEAERYGICRICPPPGWKPAFAHKPDKLKFATKEQDLGKLAGGQRLRRKFTENLRKFLFLIGKPMEAARGGKVFIDSHNSSHGCGPVDMFRLFKEVQRMGGHEAVTRKGGWVALAERMGFDSKAIGLQDAYCTYLADFEAVHNGKGLDFDGVVYTPTVYREKPSVEADIRVGMTLWHFLEEDHGAGRCYHGTVKALRGASNCIVEYDLAERFPEPHGRDGSWDAGGGSAAARGGGSSNGDSAAGGWSGAGSHLDSEGRWSRNFRASSCEEVEPFRVTLPKTQLSTLILNGKSPAAAKLAAHGVVCEVCSIAAASKNVLVVCVACDSAYHLGCVEPALPRMPFHDWFCGDCATDGNTAEDLARGPSGLFSSSTSSPSLPFVSSPSPKKTSKHVAAGSISKPPSVSKLPAAEAAAAAAAEGGDTSAPAADTPGGSFESDASAATPEKQRVPGSAVGNGSVGTRKRAEAVSPRPKRAEAAAAAAPRAENGKSSAGGGGGPAAATSTAAGKHGGGAAAAAAAAAATLNTPKKEEEEEDGSSSEGGGAEGGASPSAARMRGVSRMKGRALKYGFGNGGVFTLKEFALMADGWRSSYLARRGLGDEATEAEMEAEFWKLVGPDPPEEDVKVLYGSDLDTGAVGSGFPWTRGAVAAPGKPAVEQTERRKPRRGPGTREWDYTSYEGHSYEEDAWNLNCLPTSDGSLLQFLGTQIQGVMVPWLYVGMAFSAFCWHNEDHYLYSINYLHAGSPKRWYGVPGSMAEKFETTVKLMFPELFEAHPDLLMQLVTMAHPTEVSKRGVPVSSTTQREGEFVLTFPQAYHAGFNMGTNCAEAVNFAPPDWIPWGNAAQERYRLHKRKPVFSHEGLVLSLVDILAKNADDGVHASEELTRFLRNELTVLATHQEEMTKQAQQMGCTRFEPMEKLVERLHGGRKATASTEATAAATSIVRRSSSTCGDKGNGCADGEGASGGGGILEGLATGSAVRGPQCSVCDQYCFLTAVVCDTCDSGGLGRGAPARASSGGGGSGGSPNGDGGAAAAARRRHQRRRFACGRHLAELCACPASEYTFYQRKDEAQLRRSAKDLTSSEEYTETWVEEARLALAAAKSTGGGMVNGFRPVKGAKGSGGSSREDGASQLPKENGTGGGGGGGKVKLEAQPSSGKADGDSVRPRPANGADCSSSSDGAAEREEEPEDLQLSNSSGSSMSVDEDEAPLPSSLLPAGWNERPSLSYIGDLIRVGEELGAPEQTLEGLREIVDACAGWVKTIEGILGPDGTATTSDTCAAAVSLFGSAKRAAVAAAAAAAGGGDDADGGGRGGRSGGGGSQRNGGVRGENGGSTTVVKRKEQVPFHKAIKLLSTEGKLPGRPVDTTERLCVAIIAACRLRLQVRSLLGLGEDEHTTAARAMCLTIQEAGRTASPVELASRSVRRHPENGTGGAGDGSADSKTSGGGATGGPRGSSPCRGQGGGSNGSSAAPCSGADSGAASEAPTTISSRPGSSRTRTRTNVSAPTGTLAAERGTWKLQPWRLWPVHQPAAAALVEPCVSSVVAVPELALLRKALAALADRTDKALRMMDGGTSSSASESCGVKRGRGGATAGVGGDSAGDGGSARGRSRGSGGGGGGKVKPSGAPAAVAGSSRGGGGAGGGVLLGAAHKRRRHDDS